MSGHAPRETQPGHGVVFVMGSPHSGTTLLTLLLGSHSRAFALGEMEGLPGVLRKAPATGESCCRVCQGACPVWSRDFAEDFVARRFGPNPGLRDPRAMLARLVPFGQGFYQELFGVTGADLLVDSSKRASWLHGRLAERRDWRGATPFLVFISRDGRATVSSWRRKYPETSVADWTERWVRDVKTVEAVFEGFESTRRIHVRYEDLATAPEPALRRLCAFLGIAFEPSMIAYWTHDHHLFRANAGTVSLIGRYRSEKGQSEGAPAEALSETREAYYADLSGSIRLDERWRSELGPEDLAVFDRIAAAANRRYAHEPARAPDAPEPAGDAGGASSAGRA